MIISASRRTDIPAFYTRWFMNRIHAGYCTVPNPFNLNQVSRVSLLPEDTEVIVFWTRNAAPLLPHLTKLDQQGYRYYFQYTLLDYPRELDPKTRPAKSNINTLKRLSDQIGSEKVIWRYDPIVFSDATGVSFHLAKFSEIAKKLHGYTRRVVISIMDPYRKAGKRLRLLNENGFNIIFDFNTESQRFKKMISTMRDIAESYQMEITSCSEEINLADLGVKRGKCIDDDLIKQVFNIDVTHKKDPYQREACGCVVSKDIGVYDTCLYGCQYCYATQSFKRSKLNFKQHDPTSPSLIGHYESEKSTKSKQRKLF